jgi:hypothetical protein
MVQVLVSIPLSVSVGALVCVHAPQTWVCVNIGVTVESSLHVIVPVIVKLFPDTVTVKVNVAFDGLRVNTDPETVIVPVLVLRLEPVPEVSVYLSLFLGVKAAREGSSIFSVYVDPSSAVPV